MSVHKSPVPCEKQLSYLNPWWVTFKQAKNRGGHVHKGEKGYPCIYWNTYTPDLESGGSDASKPRAFLRYYTLFNVEQCEDLEYPKTEVKEKHFSPIEACERLVNRMPSPPGIEHRRNQAFYRPAEDIVNMPKPERFDSREAYYSTLFHEFIHSTGHESRLARPGIADELVFGSDKYSKEELIAEIGASYLCGHTSIENQIDNSAGYLAGWLRRLKGDNRLIVHAAAQAQKAADWVLGYSETAAVVKQDER